MFEQYKIDKRKTSLNSYDDQMKVFWRLLKGHFTQLLPILLLGAPVLSIIGFTTTPETIPTL